MQIRIGNKQDESSVRQLVQEIHQQNNLSFDIAGSEEDLRSIERYYFSKNGVFLVADEARIIIGFAAAASKSEDVLELKRLYVARDWRGKGIGLKLLNNVLRFGRDLQYVSIIAPAWTSTESFLCAQGFSKKAEFLEHVL